MSQISAKLLTTFFYSWLGGGLFLQIPEIKDLIQLDNVHVSIQIAVLVITFLLLAIKYSLDIYEKLRDIRNKKYPK